MVSYIWIRDRHVWRGGGHVHYPPVDPRPGDRHVWEGAGHVWEGAGHVWHMSGHIHGRARGLYWRNTAFQSGNVGPSKGLVEIDERKT